MTAPSVLVSVSFVGSGSLAVLRVTGNRHPDGRWQVILGTVADGVAAYVTAADAWDIVEEWQAVAADLEQREEAATAVTL